MLATAPSEYDYDYEPPVKYRVAWLVEHLRGECDGPSGCYECYAEMRIREDGIDGLMAEERYAEEQLARGELAGAPDEMPCHQCHLEAGNKPDLTEETVVRRQVVGVGPVLEAHRDPTASYRLECGHLAF